MKILLVEDNETIRYLASQLLKGMGHDVVVAADKDTACRIIQESVQDLDLILTDCDLPTTDEGLEVIAFAQDIIYFFRHKNVPMILMSGRDRGDAARMAGAEFLPKPFSLVELESAIKMASTRKEFATR